VLRCPARRRPCAIREFAALRDACLAPALRKRAIYSASPSLQAQRLQKCPRHLSCTAVLRWLKPCQALYWIGREILRPISGASGGDDSGRRRSAETEGLRSNGGC